MLASVKLQTLKIKAAKLLKEAQITSIKLTEIFKTLTVVSLQFSENDSLQTHGYTLLEGKRSSFDPSVHNIPKWSDTL